MQALIGPPCEWKRVVLRVVRSVFVGCSLAGNTLLHMPSHIPIKIGPPKLFPNSFGRAHDSLMASDERIVGILQDFSSQGLGEECTWFFIIRDTLAGGQADCEDGTF